MRSYIIWKEKFNDRDGNALRMYDAVFSPDSTQIAATVGSNIYIFSSNNGSFILSLKNHRDTVFSLSYSLDGKRFASAGADKQVIIWTSKYEGILKYSHNESVKCIQFNPLTGQLASCTSTDFGIWSPEQKSVTKHKISSAINACCWSTDGHYLALGTSSGFVSLRSRNGEERIRIEINKGLSPVYGLSFSPLKENEKDTLAVVDWSQSLKFFDITGKQIGKGKQLGYDPLCISYFANTELMMISGSNREALLYTKEGKKIGSIFEDDSWIWAAKSSSDGKRIAIATNDGSLVLSEINFTTVHSICKERYAFRENMTDVVVQNLNTGEKVRVKCHDLVKKVSIYKNRLAIQLPQKLVIYETSEKSDEEEYKIIETISYTSECSSMIICGNVLILCLDKKLQTLSFKGNLEREWILDSMISYVKVICGKSGSEGILLGLSNGQILQIFINNPFPINIIKMNYSIRCLNLSMLRNKFVAVDDEGNCIIFDLNLKQIVHQDTNVTSAAWNDLYEEMIAFSSFGKFLSIKVADFPAYHQNSKDIVVGFSGSKVFCLRRNSIIFVEIPQSIPMFQYLEKSMFKKAYEVACLKVTDYEWEQLAFRALESMELDIAKKAFARVKNYLFLDLIHSYTSKGRPMSKSSELSFLGDIHAYRNHFNEAAKAYKQAGDDEKAVNMYTDLRMFDQAQKLIGSSNTQYTKQLAIKRADWIKNINEPRAAAELYLSAGDITKAIEIIGEHGWIDMLMNIVRDLDKGDHKNLSLCGEYLLKNKHYFPAAEVYKKIGDINTLAFIYVNSFQWQEAFNLVQEYPILREVIYVPYATWLLENHRFIEAQQAFHKAGKLSTAVKVLDQLIKNAINEHRFNDASYYSWILSMQCLDLAKDSQGSEQDYYINKFHKFQEKADIYYAYHNIHRYMEEPFTSFFPDALFNMARFLFHETLNNDYPGVSKVCILYAFAKQGRNLGAYKLARLIYEKLHTLYIPEKFRDAIEMGDVTIRAKPFSDAEDLLPLCYRCSTTNPLYNNKGNRCINCQQPFMFSFANFDTLPIVEFELEGMDEEEAIKIISSDYEILPKIGKKLNDFNEKNKWKEEKGETFQTLNLECNYELQKEDGENDNEKDPFMQKMNSFQENEELIYKPIVVNRDILKQINPNDVIIVDWPYPLKKKFYRNLMPDVNIDRCPSCQKLFHTDEYETQILQCGYCPFCRNPSNLVFR